MSISQRQAKALSDLMEKEHAIRATTSVITIFDVEAQVVVLDHVDREDDTWQSVHVLDYVSGSACIGNRPKEASER